VMPNGFVQIPAGALNFANLSLVSYTALPTTVSRPSLPTAAWSRTSRPTSPESTRRWFPWQRM
jgi:hypothetical protein